MNITDKIKYLKKIQELERNIRGSKYKKRNSRLYVEGMLGDREGEALFNLAKYGPGKGEIVEIGSRKGKSTIYLAKGSKEANREIITAIDLFEGSPEHKKILKGKSTFYEFKKNIRSWRCNTYINPLKMSSEKAVEKWNKPIRLLFIDGAHEYEIVEKDFLMWEPHVIKGGVIAFHDVGLFNKDWKDGPTKTVEKYIKKSNTFKEIALIGTLFIARKIK